MRVCQSDSKNDLKRKQGPSYDTDTGSTSIFIQKRPTSASRIFFSAVITPRSSYTRTTVNDYNEGSIYLTEQADGRVHTFGQQREAPPRKLRCFRCHNPSATHACIAFAIARRSRVAGSPTVEISVLLRGARHEYGRCSGPAVRQLTRGTWSGATLSCRIEQNADGRSRHVPLNAIYWVWFHDTCQKKHTQSLRITHPPTYFSPRRALHRPCGAVRWRRRRRKIVHAPVEHARGSRE